jgi:hypothetical protein
MVARLPSGANPPAAIAAGSLSLLDLFLFAGPFIASLLASRLPRPILSIATVAVVFLVSFIMTGILISKRGLHLNEPLLLAAYYAPIVGESMLPVRKLFSKATLTDLH